MRDGGKDQQRLSKPREGQTGFPDLDARATVLLGGGMVIVGPSRKKAR